MFKEGLLKGWINSQIGDYDEDPNGLDTSWYNFNHTYSDFGLSNRTEALETFLDLVSIEQPGGVAAYYPNNPLRAAFDASRAYINENGEGDATGAFSRYKNLDMPVYNLGGWWDIFAKGQIELWQHSRAALDPNGRNYHKQKLILGPWQHYYPASQAAGDLVFPRNVGEVLGVTANFEGDEEEIIDAILNANLEDLLKSELFSFIRSSTNFNEHKNVGTPQIRLPKNERFQQLIGNFLIQIPSEDYALTHADLINFLGGEAPLEFMPSELYFKFNGDTVSLGPLNLTIPPLPDFITDIFGGISEEFGEFPLYQDFDLIPDVRYYVCGPINDSVPENEYTGNYWVGADTFPIVNGISHNRLFLHHDGTLNSFAPDEIEEKVSYSHDPDHPVRTIGGNNLDIKTPDDRQSMGPLDLSNPIWDTLTLNRDDVISFETDPFEDSVQIIGYIKAKLYASAMPENATQGDPTDTDFIVRLVDVYPFGGEYFITEGNVNARAREYVRSIAEGNENDDAPISNIESDKIYEYYFNFSPTAYTFGKGHRMKILISSSNHPRFQSNPNLPLEDDEFFRRYPNQDLTYNFGGQEMSARISNNSVHFEPEYPSHIVLPLMGREIEFCGAPDSIFVTNLTDSTATLNWRGAAGTIDYLVRYHIVGSSTWEEVSLQNTSLNITGLESGNNYEWQVYSLCQDETELSTLDTFFIEGELTYDSEDLQRFFSVYPNPVSDALTIQIKKGDWRNSVVIYNSDGKTISVLSIDNINLHPFSIDMNPYQSGNYFVEFEDQLGNKATVPIVKIE